MRIEVLVSTYGDRIYGLDGLLASLPQQVTVLVIHQGATKPYDYQSTFAKWPAVRVIPSHELGLAKSRNLALTNATGDIVLPTDDDVEFVPDAFTHVEKEFAHQPDADAITFQIVTPDGGPYKNYRNRRMRHSAFTISRVSSIEIALRRATVTGRNVRWDERFGLKGRFGGGLELAFMRNLLSAGCRAFYAPIPIVVHPRVSTGHAHTPESAVFRGAVYAKLYGWASLLLLPGFAVKNAWRTGSITGAIRYTGNLFRGAAQLLRDGG